MLKMRFDIQMFGGRGQKSTIPQKISKKMTRVYWTSSGGVKYLSGYKYNGYDIEIEDEKRPYSMYGTKRWYHVTFKDGEKLATDNLREMKEAIEEDIEKNKRRK